MTIETLIVILNYRTADLTIQCLRSLEHEVEDRKTTVIVVDNCSGDGSAEIIGKAIQDHDWDHWVSLMALHENRGYAAGNNAAIRQALTWYKPPKQVLILNADTIVREGAIHALTDFLDQHPQVGIAGSCLECLDGTKQEAAFRFPSLLSELDSGLRLGIASRLLSRWAVAPPIQPHAHQADWVAGASFMVRTSVFHDVGLLDEAFFLYYEEIDFCVQAQRAGWECWYVPTSHVVHLVGQSTGFSLSGGSRKRRPAYWFASRRRFFQKNFGWFYAVAADLMFVLGFGLWRVRRALQRKEDPDPAHLLWDSIQYSSAFHKLQPQEIDPSH